MHVHCLARCKRGRKKELLLTCYSSTAHGHVNFWYMHLCVLIKIQLLYWAIVLYSWAK